MKLVISYNNNNAKTLIKIGDEKPKELTFEELLSITNNVIDNDEKYELSLSGFDENLEVEENYKKVFEDIFALKNDPEIIDLKKQIEKLEKSEDK